MSFLNTYVFGNTVWMYLAFAGIGLSAFIVGNLVRWVIRKQLIDRAEETENKIDDVIAALGAKPFFWLIFTSGLYLGLTVLALPEWVTLKLWNGFLIVWTVIAAVFLIRFVKAILARLIERQYPSEGNALYITVMKTGGSTVAVGVWIVAAIFIISNLGFDVSAILTGLGIGGLAMALASKDTLSNIFGSVTILINGPFRVGEVVLYQGHEGTVEELGLRDTRIRTFDGHLVVVPNALAPTSVVVNISRRPNVRVLFNLSLAKATLSDKVEKAREIVREATKDVRIDGDVKIHLIDIGAGAHKLQVLYHIKDPKEFLDTKHEINTRIIDGLATANITL